MDDPDLFIQIENPRTIKMEELADSDETEEWGAITQDFEATTSTPTSPYKSGSLKVRGDLLADVTLPQQPLPFPKPGGSHDLPLPKPGSTHNQAPRKVIDVTLNPLLPLKYPCRSKVSLHTPVPELLTKVAELEDIIAKMIHSNNENVTKFTEHIEKFQMTIKQKESQIINLKSGKAVVDKKNLEAQVDQLQGVISRQNDHISRLQDELTKRVSQGDSGSSRRGQWEVLHPSVPGMSENGIFFLRNSDKSNLCVELPIQVDSDPEGNKLKIRDEDVAQTRQNRVARRQRVLLQIVDLLTNPLNNPMSKSRAQHLVWILLLSVLNKYGFKDPSDKYLLRSNDTICLKPDLIIKTHRPDLAQQFAGVMVSSVKERELDVMKRLSRMPQNETLNVDQQSEQVGKKMAPGPKCRTSLPKEACTRNVSFESYVMKAAKWNSSKGRGIFTESNRKFLVTTMRTSRLPLNVDEKPVVVGFLKMLDHLGEYVFVPFPVMPGPDQRKNSINLLDCTAITGFVKGTPHGINNQVYLSSLLIIILGPIYT